MTEMERATIDMLVAPGGALAIASLVISSMVMGGVLMWFLMRQERRKYECYAFRDSVMGLSMREGRGPRWTKEFGHRLGRCNLP